MSPPSPPVAPLDIELPAIATSVQTARHAVAAFCIGQTLDHDGIAIAVSEAVGNAVTHAYRDRATGPVRVFAEWEPAALVVLVSDDGQGMTPRGDSPGLGLGLLLIARVTASLQIDEGDTGTRLTMRFGRGA